jgi:hypothetical protein
MRNHPELNNYVASKVAPNAASGSCWTQAAEGGGAMKAHGRLDAAVDGRAGRPDGWRTSGRQAGLGIGAWVLAVLVVAVFALGLHLLYE